MDMLFTRSTQVYCLYITCDTFAEFAISHSPASLQYTLHWTTFNTSTLIVATLACCTKLNWSHCLSHWWIFHHHQLYSVACNALKLLCAQMKTQQYLADGRQEECMFQVNQKSQNGNRSDWPAITTSIWQLQALQAIQASCNILWDRCLVKDFLCKTYFSNFVFLSPTAKWKNGIRDACSTTDNFNGWSSGLLVVY